MVDAFPPDRSDQPFGEAVLARRAWRDRFVADAHGSQPVPDGDAVDLIPIADQVARALVPRECLRDLACDPVRARICCGVDPKSPGGINSPHGLILFDGVCILCSRGCRFVSKRDRRGYFRFVPIQLAEGRPLAEQLGIDPDRPDSFAFVATGQAYVKSEAALRIARELPRWQWTWVFHFIPRVIRDAIYDLVSQPLSLVRPS